MYVPVRRRDWDPHDEDSESETPVGSEDDAASVENDADDEEQSVLVVAETVGVEDDLFEGDFLPKEGAVDDEDERWRECYEDMSLVGSLNDDSIDEAAFAPAAVERLLPGASGPGKGRDKKIHL